MCGSASRHDVYDWDQWLRSHNIDMGNLWG